MKKIVGTIAAVALVAASAFADVGIGAWGRAIWAPVGFDGGNLYTGTMPSWSWATNCQPRVGISIHGDSENVGFNIDMNADGNWGAVADASSGNVRLGDTAFIWVKPWSWLELQIGKFQDNSMRSDACFGMFNWVRAGIFGDGEDFIFTRMGDGAGSQAKGAYIKITPVEGLWIAAALNLDGTINSYANGQYGAGYTIANVGNIKAQYIGSKNMINAAFDLTGVENIYASIGAKIGFGGNVEIDAYGKFNLSIVTLHAMFGIQIGGASLPITAGVGADFDFGNGVGLNVDVRYKTTSTIGFGVGLTKGLANGVVGIGFEGILNGGNWTSPANGFGFVVPVRAEYWF